MDSFACSQWIYRGLTVHEKKDMIVYLVFIEVAMALSVLCCLFPLIFRVAHDWSSFSMFSPVLVAGFDGIVVVVVVVVVVEGRTKSGWLTMGELFKIPVKDADVGDEAGTGDVLVSFEQPVSLRSRFKCCSLLDCIRLVLAVVISSPLTLDICVLLVVESAILMVPVLLVLELDVVVVSR